jgi:thiamine-monophosphate kinase
LNELSRVELLRRILSAGELPRGVEVGIGDDAAVLAAGSGSLVWTVDSAVEGVHFRREWLSCEDIGWRSLAAAASDLAAMGATPRGVLSALVLPEAFTDAELEALARGQAAAATALGTAVLGGNLARGSELSITTTVLGQTPRPLLRKGATVGDVVAIAGPVGVAAAGLELLRRGPGDGAGAGAWAAGVAVAVHAWRRPLARVADGCAAAGRAHAGIDVSDGLALDAWRLAEQSAVGIVLDEVALLTAAGPALASAAAIVARDPLELALFGGEDYALFMAFAPGELVAPFAPVGECVAGGGLWLRARGGETRPIEPRGFDHFAK